MFCQIGNREYSNINSPSVLSYAGENANIVELALINQKPILQHTGVGLQTISMQFKHRVEYTNITTELELYKEWKTNGTILPIIMGNGAYIGDFLLKSSDYEVLQTLSDGTTLEVRVMLEFVEYVAFSEAEKQAKEDRKNAIAVGANPTNERVLKESPEALAHKELMLAQVETNNAVEEAKQLKNTSPLSAINSAKKQLNKAKEKVDSTRNRILSLQNSINGAVSIGGALSNLGSALSGLDALLAPPLSITSIDNAIVSINNATNNTMQNALTFTTNAILRKF